MSGSQSAAVFCFLSGATGRYVADPERWASYQHDPQLTPPMKAPSAILFFFFAGCTHGPSPAQPAVGYGEEREFVGMFIENSQESIFFPCGIRLADDGWWLRFEPNVGADMVRYQYQGPGYPTSTHDIRVRGRLSPPGRFGTGFHTRELVVSRLIEAMNPGRICASYSPKPAKWNGAGPVHLGVRSAISSDDGSLVAILDWFGEFTVWSTASREVQQHFLSEQTWAREDGTALPLAFSPDNGRLAAGGSDGFVRVWSLNTGRVLWRLPNSETSDTLASAGRIHLIRGNASPVAGVAFSPDGSILLSSGGLRAYAWSMTSGNVIDTLALYGMRRAGSPDRVLFVRDPTRIVASGPDAALRVYGMNAGPPLFTAAVPSGLQLAAVSPDNRWLALRGAEDSVFLWSLAEGRIAQRFAVPHFLWGGLAFSPDSKKIAIAAGAFAIYIWDTSTGVPLRSIHGLAHTSRHMWFTPGGDSIVVSASFDSSLFVIPLERGLNAESVLRRTR